MQAELHIDTPFNGGLDGRPAGGETGTGLPMEARSNASEQDLMGPDALVQDISIDALAKTVAIRLLSRPDARTHRRVPLELLFQDVEAVTVDADMIELYTIAEAGAVDHWHLAPAAGSSYIHMARGQVSVAARTAPELTRLHR